MGDHYEIVIPRAARNLIKNPSLELNDTGWILRGSATGGRIVGGKFGSYCYEANGAGSTDGLAYDGFDMSSGTTYAISFYAFLANGVSFNIDVVNALWVLITRATVTGPGEWRHYRFMFPIALPYPSSKLEITGAGKIRIDAAQFEVIPNVPGLGLIPLTPGGATTYIDGDRPGCEWVGAPHASESRRIAATREGGAIVNLDDIGFNVERYSGIGMPPIRTFARETAFVDGAVVQGQKALPRVVQLVGHLNAVDRPTFHTVRRAVVEAIRPRATRRAESFILRYKGTSAEETALRREMRAYYDAGFEWGDVITDVEKTAIRLLVPDPFVREEAENVIELDAPAFIDTKYVNARILGDWSTLVPPTSVGGATPSVRAIVREPATGKIYIGGNFTDWDGIAAADYIAVWDEESLSWAAVGPSTLTGICFALAFDAAGNLYAGGRSYVKKWNGSTWTDLGAVTGGTSSDVISLAIDEDGNLVAGGDFSSLGGVTCRRIGKYNGSSWSELGTGFGDVVQSVIYDPVTSNLYAGGLFTQDGTLSTTLRRIAVYNRGSATFDELAQGVAGGVLGYVIDMTVDAGGILYVAGDFDTDGPGSVTNLNNLATVYGNTLRPVGLGTDASVYSADALPDGRIAFSGVFQFAGGIPFDRVALWNGTRFEPLPIKLPGSPICYKIFGFDRQDGIDLWIGHNVTGTANTTAPVMTTVNPNSTAPVYPWIQINRSGGTSVRLIKIENLTTGKVLNFDYDIQNGEEIVLDLRPLRQSMTSSIFGSAWKVDPESDADDFYLLPGVDNEIVVYADIAGAATVNIFLHYVDTFWTVD